MDGQTDNMETQCPASHTGQDIKIYCKCRFILGGGGGIRIYHKYSSNFQTARYVQLDFKAEITLYVYFGKDFFWEKTHQVF